MHYFNIQEYDLNDNYWQHQNRSLQFTLIPTNESQSARNNVIIKDYQPDSSDVIIMQSITSRSADEGNSLFEMLCTTPQKCSTQYRPC